jgi:hypothetical protein
VSTIIDDAPRTEEARDHEDAAPPERVANDEGRDEDRADRVLEGVREEDRDDRPEGTEDRSEEAMSAKTAIPEKSRFTEEQLKFADAQNRPPFNRSHGDIAKELGTNQAHLSRLLKTYREHNGLDAPDVVANRKAALAEKGETPKKKATKEKAMPTATAKKPPKKPKAEKKPVEKKPAPAEAPLAKRPERSGKIVGIPLEGVIADAEKAKVEADQHKGACPDCEGKVSANQLCMIGRALTARWARLEFIAVSA